MALHSTAQKNKSLQNKGDHRGGFEELLERKNKGSLKIYLGYAAGVGKTFAMLSEAQRLQKQGYDVVVGYVEPHARPETAALVEGLEVIPPRKSGPAERPALEMDRAAILARKPNVVIVDELAHTNQAGSELEKRYQDVYDLLDHGINVISTLNVQHLESIAEKVDSALSVPVTERIPDFVLQRADQIVHIDVSIEDLRERIRSGKIYSKDKIDQALTHFFLPENLSLLRKLALQEAAGDQRRRIQIDGLLSKHAQHEANEAVMIALSSDPTHAEHLIRKGTKLAAQVASQCYAVYVQRPQERPEVIDPGLQRRLLENLNLAKKLGAEVVRLEGTHVSDLLVQFATTHYIKHAFFGKTRKTPFQDRLWGSVLLEFLHDSVAVDVHIVCRTEDEKYS